MAAATRCTITPRRRTAFGYFEDILDPANRLSLIVGLSNDQFRFRISAGCSRRSATTSRARREFLSDNLNENQHELAEYAILSLAALAGRPRLADLALGALHQPALRAGLGRGSALQRHRPERVQGRHRARLADRCRLQDRATRIPCVPASITSTTAPRATRPRRSCPLNAQGMQTSDVPLTIPDNGTQIAGDRECLSAGRVEAPDAADHQLRRYVTITTVPIPAAASSVRASTSCGSSRSGTTVHGGYSRYFTPPPFELIAQPDALEIRRHFGACRRALSPKTRRRSPSAPITTISVCSRSCWTTR